MKVAVSIPDNLVNVVDKYVLEHPETTRSGVCAKALLLWVAEQQGKEIEEYYLTMSDEEKAEDKAWLAIAAESARIAWLRDD